MHPGLAGTGIALVPVGRVRRWLDTYADRLRRRAFTERERAYARGPSEAERLAARLAAKLALRAALAGLTPRLPVLRDVEVLRPASGPPTLALHGATAPFARRPWQLHLSMSHVSDLAIASVWVERETGR